MSLFHRLRSAAHRAPGRLGLVVEMLEARQLLSTSAIAGYTPAQVRHAYGFDKVALAGGAAADGSGQTIAIVDAFNHPNVAADLATFSAQFGLPAADLTVVNQRGGAKLPVTDAGWAGEIALDVEWAHAIAPAADILLVEANSDSLGDLLSAVDYARHATGVSAVSMSWGGSEFFSWSGGESDSETSFDPYFTTPTGHQGVTFVASAGDTGAQAGVQWPSASPNVLSVGGTRLFTSDAAGTYAGETGWSGTNGGFSQVEPEPTYQLAVQTTGVRTSPDVAYDADPNAGFAVYDSVPFNGVSGWQEVGGTSAGAPQWAALVAMADQGRALSGLGSLDGATQTLPALYAAHVTSSSYAAEFNDVLSGGGTTYRWRWGGTGRSGYTAQAGYDLVTGLGSPDAAALVPALANYAAATSGTANGGNTTPVPTELPPSPLSVKIVSSPASTHVIGGTGGSITVRIINRAGEDFSGPAAVTVYASTDRSVSTDDATVGLKSLGKLNLRAGHAKTLTLKFDYPTTLSSGSYRLLASVDATGTNTAPAVASAAKIVHVKAATVDLSTAFAGHTPIDVSEGGTVTAKIKIRNVGTVTASGTLDLSLYGSSDATLDGGDVLLASRPSRKINLKPGKSVTLTVRFTDPQGLAGGTFDLIASTRSSTTPADTDTADNAAVAETTKA